MAAKLRSGFNRLRMAILLNTLLSFGRRILDQCRHRNFFVDLKGDARPRMLGDDDLRRRVLENLSQSV